MKTILVDADSLCFHAFDITLEQALDTLESKIKTIKYLTGSEKLLFFLTIGRNFRFDLLPSYKQNRDGNKRPEFTKEMKQYLIDKYNAIQNPELEADDMVCDMYRLNPDMYMIASIDKDILYNMVGTHLNLYDMNIVQVSEELAHYHFNKQIILGDPTDNIKNICKGIGENRLKSMIVESGMNICDVAQYLCNRFDVCYRTRYRLLYCGELDLDRIELKTFEENENIEYYIQRYVFKNKEHRNPSEDNKPTIDLKRKIQKYNKYDSENSKIDFGKFKGVTFKELYSINRNYFLWLYNATNDTDMKYIMNVVIENT